MDLRTYLQRVASDYDDSGDIDTAAHDLLKNADRHLADEIPPGFEIDGRWTARSGGRAVPTSTPSICFFDFDVNRHTEDGLFVAYVFSADLRYVHLTLNQSLWDLEWAYSDERARELAATDAYRIRSRLEAKSMLPLHFNDVLQLRSGDRRALAYEAANIASRRYSVAELPGVDELRKDLGAALQMLTHACFVKHQLLTTDPGLISAPGSDSLIALLQPTDPFKPADEQEFRHRLMSSEVRRSRRHERLVRTFRIEALRAGFDVDLPRAVDLTLDRSDRGVVVVTAKVVRNGDTRPAVRKAIGELLEYRHFFCRDQRPTLLALFSEDVGAAYRSLLDELGIGCVWKDAESWSTTVDGLLQPPIISWSDPSHSDMAALLRRLDREAIPTSFEFDRENSDIEELSGVLGSARGLEMRKTHAQDASFHTDLIAVNGTFELRFSQWGRLAALLVASNPDSESVAPSVDDRAEIERLLAKYRFVLVPDEVLMQRYDGVHPGYFDVADGRWFDRFFQYD